MYKKKLIKKTFLQVEKLFLKQKCYVVEVIITFFLTFSRSRVDDSAGFKDDVQRSRVAHLLGVAESRTRLFGLQKELRIRNREQPDAVFAQNQIHGN